MGRSVHFVRTGLLWHRADENSQNPCFHLRSSRAAQWGRTQFRCLPSNWQLLNIRPEYETKIFHQMINTTPRLSWRFVTRGLTWNSAGKLGDSFSEDCRSCCIPDILFEQSQPLPALHLLWWFSFVCLWFFFFCFTLTLFTSACKKKVFFEQKIWTVALQMFQQNHTTLISYKHLQY